MRRNRGALLLAGLAALAASDAAWLAAEARREPWSDSSRDSRPDDSRDLRPGDSRDLRPGGGFQRATASLGLSCATSPEWCFFALDPRCESICESELQPLPGLACPSPVHGAGVADLPPAR